MIKHNSNPSFPLQVRVYRVLDRSFEYAKKKELLSTNGEVVKVKTDEMARATHITLQCVYTDADGFESSCSAVPCRDWSPDLSGVRGDYILSVEQFSTPRDSEATVVIFNGFEAVAPSQQKK